MSVLSALSSSTVNPVLCQKEKLKEVAESFVGGRKVKHIT
jgi:hypothetical protein